MSSIRNDIHRFDAELNSITEALARNQQRQSHITKSIAKIRLNELDQGGVVEALDSLDREVTRLLAKRDKSLTDIEEKILNVAQKLEQLEQQRDTLSEEAETNSEAVIQIEHEIQESLEEDADYQAQLEVAREADSIADEAKSKARVAVEDCTAKGVPYQQDPLFIYLWDRKYGTTEYKANLITRLLDGWVARLCNFEPARANYWTLQEIPGRLIQHAKTAKKMAERAMEELEALEVAAANQAGLRTSQEKLRLTEEAIEKKDAEIAQSENQEQELLDQRALLATGEDPSSKEALTRLTEALQGNDFYVLEQKVNATKSREDDLLLRDLRELQEEAIDWREDLRESRLLRDAQIRQIRELEDVRRKFKRRRYDDVRSGFNKEEIIASMLGQFLRGVIQGSDLWNTMKRHQRHRDVGAWPDFGSGGLRRRTSNKKSKGKSNRNRKPGVWHNPGRKSGGDFRLPRNGGFSSRGRRGRSGGFKTGGGF